MSARRRREVIDALRRGTVPSRGLDLLAVGLGPFERALADELGTVSGGGSVFKAVRGEYGSGKTFFARHLAERALRRGFATSEVQVSETETPLHRLETVYRRVVESLRTASVPPSAFRSVLDAWLFTLESDVANDQAANDQAGDDQAGDDQAGEGRAGDDQAGEGRAGEGQPGNCQAGDGQFGAGQAGAGAAVDAVLDQRLSVVNSKTPAFAQALRGYRAAVAAGDGSTADSLMAWLGAQPHVAAAAKRSAGIRGDLDHFGAMGALQGLLIVLRDAGHPGLLIVLDEVETLQRVRGDVRDKALNALRQLIDEMDTGRFPGLYLMITGTPAFFEGPSGISRLPPLAQRLHADFTADQRFDNPRAVQIRLPGFTRESLVELGTRVRDLYADGSEHAERVRRLADDRYLGTLADAVAGSLGGRVGVAPRVYLKKLVGDVLDRIDQFDDFDPRRDYRLTVTDAELTETERNAGPRADRPRSADDVDLDL